MDALPQSILSQTANLPVSAGIAATRRTIRPFLTAILFLVMGFTLSQGNTVFAEEFSTTTATIGNPVEVVELTDEVHQTDDEFLCGWVPLGTHDSVPALVPVPAEPVSASDTPITVPNNNSLFAATTKSLKVTVEKIAEPFVQMGPRIQNSLQQIEAYQRWWQQKVDRSTVDEATPTISNRPSAPVETGDEPAAPAITDVEILIPMNDDPCDAPLPTEAIEITALGPSVLSETAGIAQSENEHSTEATLAADKLNCNAELGEPGIEIRPLRRRVGSTAVIATIKEAYLPYDIAAKDMRLWNMLPASTRPYEIRQRVATSTRDEMWDEFDQHILSDQQPIPETPVPDIPVADRPAPDIPETELTDEPVVFACASPYCLMDETIYTLQHWAAADGPLARWVKPRHVGRRIAGIVDHGQDLLYRATGTLASAWPAAEPGQEEEPSPAGRALLVRAGASDQESPDAIALMPELSCRR